MEHETLIKEEAANVNYPPTLRDEWVSRSNNMKNWTGNQNSIYKTLGASNHTDKDREQLLTLLNYCCIFVVLKRPTPHEKTQSYILH